MFWRFISHHFFYITIVTLKEAQTYFFLSINWLNLSFPQFVAKARTKIHLCASTTYFLYFGQVTAQFATQYGRGKFWVVNFVHNLCFMLIVETAAKISNTNNQTWDMFMCKHHIFVIFWPSNPSICTQYGRDKFWVVNCVHNLWFMLIVKTVAGISLIYIISRPLLNSKILGNS